MCSEGSLTIEAASTASTDGSGQSGGEEKLPRFQMVAYTGSAIMQPGWPYPIIVELSGLTIAAQKLPIRFAHSAYQGVGHTERIAVEGGKLIAEGVISRDTEQAREIVVSGRRGFPWQASIGGPVLRQEFVKAGGTATVNGKTVKGPVYIARQMMLSEISFVDLGADGKTSARVAATSAGSNTDDSQQGERTQNMTFEQWLEAKGFNCGPHGLTATQSASLKAMYEAEQKTVQASAADGDDVDDDDLADDDAGTGTAGTKKKQVKAANAGDANVDAGDDDKGGVLTTIEAARKEAAGEVRRQTKIRELCGERHAEIAAKAIENGWTVNRTELEVLRASRPQAPYGFVRTGSDHGAPSELVVQAALCQAGGMGELDKAFSEQVLNAADQRYKGQLGLQQLLLEAAWANGYDGRTFRMDIKGVLQAAFSTMSLPGILSNTANKFLMAGFNAVESTWRSIAAIRPVSDFKQITSYRLTGGMVYEEVGADGELKHAQVGEASYTNQARTYGRMFAITRTDLINDDLGALTETPRKLGRGGALKLNDVFWTRFMDNAAFFAAGNKNYAEGAGTAFGIDALTQAEQMFLDQTDDDGHPLAVTPSILLVPNALFVPANQLMSSTEVREDGGSSKSKYATKNPHAGKFRTERSSYLSNATYTGNSTKAWYLLADPQDMPVVEVVFLNGRQEPTVESADADFNILGIQMRGYHDFGVSLKEPRGGAKMKGEA